MYSGYKCINPSSRLLFPCNPIGLPLLQQSCQSNVTSEPYASKLGKTTCTGIKSQSEQINH